MKKTIIISICTILLISYSCSNKSNKSQGKNESMMDTIPVKASKITLSEFSFYGEYYGNVTGLEEVTLTCITGGRVENIMAKEGKKIQANEPLAKIDAQKATTTYKMAVLGENIAKSNFERTKEHFAEGNASKLALDRAELAWLQAKSAKLNAKKAYEGALCISPISGTVINRNIQLYQEVRPGTPTFTISKLHTMKVLVGVPEKDAIDIKTNDPAEIFIDSYPNRVWKAKIYRISKKISGINRDIQIELHIKNKDKAIVSGSTARVKIYRNVKRNSIVIPTSSIITRENKTYVFIVQDNKAKQTDVELGLSNNTHTIIKKGLDISDNLIVQGQHLLHNNSQILIID